MVHKLENVLVGQKVSENMRERTLDSQLDTSTATKLDF